MNDLPSDCAKVTLDEAENKEDANNQEFRWVYFGRQRGWNLTNEIGMKTERHNQLHEVLAKLVVEIDTPGVIERFTLTLITAIISSVFAFRWAYSEIGNWFIPTIFAFTVFSFVYLLYALTMQPSFRTPRNKASLVITGVYILADILLIWID